jgi:hypothetical protein
MINGNFLQRGWLFCSYLATTFTRFCGWVVITVEKVA